MKLPIQLISTDFDGTLFAEFENPPVPDTLQALIGSLQSQGAKWVINTGRDLSSLMETLGRGHVRIHPDYLVLVEREIYYRDETTYLPLEHWNQECTRRNQELFAKVREDLGRITAWIRENFKVTLYEDAYSPLCVIADNNEDADALTDRLQEYAATRNGLAVVRNDVYIRFCHTSYNKGTALAEIGRRTGISAHHTFAIGDHWNDLPMLEIRHARCLAAPSNAVPEVRKVVEQQGGYVSRQPYGHGVARSLEHYLEDSGVLATRRRDAGA
jgi:HAD superfamily hydrolase (TIGR01484 family)